MFDIRERPQMVERAFLIGAYFDKREEKEAISLFEELEELVNTLGIGIIDSRLVYVRDPNKRYLTGTGKAVELMELAKAQDCDCIIFDNALSPLQQRWWENDTDVCVIDRPEVIIDIFAMRARSKEARLQVKLARLEYSLPRLAKMWDHLDRQGGGTGGGKGGAGAARGEGEKQVEVDRRLARKQIDTLKAEIEAVRKIRTTQRKEREKLPIPHAAIVGYTNAGKSTLLNHLTGSEVLAEDKLFATLDTTTRRLPLPDGQEILVTDTVGFVRNLPHDLVDAFKATLEEATLADFLLHILDASNPSILKFHGTTTEVLSDLGAGETKQLVVLNKIDLVTDPAQLQALDEHFPDAIRISAVTGQGMDELTSRMNALLLDRVSRLELLIPHSESNLAALLHREAKVLEEEYVAEGIEITAIVPHHIKSHFAHVSKVPFEEATKDPWA